jgi:general secretion pathway protein F
VFSPLYVATVRAAEKTSDLAPALSRYVAYQTQLEAIRKRAVNAAIYPMILIAAGALVSLFLLLYVVPRFGKIYEDRTADLPFFSQLLIGWGQLVEGHALLVVAVLYWLFSFLDKETSGRGWATRCGASRRSASGSRSTSSRASTAPPGCCCGAACRS